MSDLACSRLACDVNSVLCYGVSAISVMFVGIFVDEICMKNDSLRDPYNPIL